MNCASTICRGDADPWKLAAQWAQTAESIGAGWPLEKEPKWVPLADWCKTIGQNQECFKQAAKAYSYFAGNKACKPHPGSPRWFFRQKRAPLSAVILNVPPCWGPMQKDSRNSFRSACANRATQIGGIVKQNKWQSGAMQRHGRLFLSLVPIQAFSGYTRRDSWTATLHARPARRSPGKLEEERKSRISSEP